MKHRLLAFGLGLMLAGCVTAPVNAVHAGAGGGTVAGGAAWTAQVPPGWNGTLLLYSRGYAPAAGDPSLAPADWRQPLLDAGYALAASNYGSGGWALAEAVPAQRATIAAFAKAFGKPRRVIAWGQSMGGLVTTALAEQDRPAVDGAIAFCPSIAGAVGMMNMGLDGAFTVKALLAPSDPELKLVGIADDMANGRRAGGVVGAALGSPAGRARIALAGVLGGIPGWTKRGSPAPDPADSERAVDEIGAALVMGTFMPRADQERRAGGVFSWNTGIDYAAQLDASGRRPLIEALYRKAGLDLNADLAALASAPRIAADPGAVRYMLAHYTASARPRVPILSVQAVGDGSTSPSLQQAYLDAAEPRMAHGLWRGEAGHCGESAATAMAALKVLETRLSSGRWPSAPAGFTAHRPAPMLRPCRRGGPCR